MADKTAIVLVVDPDAEQAQVLARLLTHLGARAVVCSGGSEALRLLNSEPAQVLICTLNVPDMPLGELLTALDERWPGLPSIVVAEGADAVTALKLGAADLLEKPFDQQQVAYVLGKALATIEGRADRPPPPRSGSRAGLLGGSPVMVQTYATLERAAQGTATVLVRGESGTGKELVARALHDGSPRARLPFVKIDCAALPENLLDSELFGYEKGAFTGAVGRKLGRVELADKGTLFLDEIGELSLALQAKLLRLLQHKQFERLGGTRTIQVDTRLVAATHRDLETMVDRGEFRLDLFYRLNVVPIWLPPLRARREDIELLSTHFCRVFGAANGRPSMALEGKALHLLRAQRWPGNVRQLENFIERLVVLATGDVITEEQVHREMVRKITFKTQPGSAEQAAQLTAIASAPLAASEGVRSAVVPLSTEMAAAEKRALERALRHTEGNRSKAARLLQLSRSTLYAKLQEHGLL